MNDPNKPQQLSQLLSFQMHLLVPKLVSDYGVLPPSTTEWRIWPVGRLPSFRAGGFNRAGYPGTRFQHVVVRRRNSGIHGCHMAGTIAWAFRRGPESMRHCASGRLTACTAIFPAWWPCHSRWTTSVVRSEQGRLAVALIDPFPLLQLHAPFDADQNVCPTVP